MNKREIEEAIWKLEWQLGDIIVKGCPVCKHRTVMERYKGVPYCFRCLGCGTSLREGLIVQEKP